MLSPAWVTNSLGWVWMIVATMTAVETRILLSHFSDEKLTNYVR
tara:strand:- start:3 stop:134 length:132 start_codon:yes stop_codon:yes gene_type:complete